MLNQKLMVWTNYHSHTSYCDGSDEPEQYVLKAIKEGLPAYGFSGHAPLCFKTDWNISDADFGHYLLDVNKLKQKYASDIQIYTGLEIDFIPNIAGRYKHVLKNCNIDYFIGSIHFVDQFSDGTPWNIDTSKDLFIKGLKEIFSNNFRNACERFYELSWQMLDADKPDIIGHLDKIKMYNNELGFFSENVLWYKKLIDHILNKIKLSETIVEINTRGYYRYKQKDMFPSAWIIEKIIDKKIPVMLNSDAHSPHEITAGFNYAAKELHKLGLKELWTLYNNKWQSRRFNAEGLIW
jgi:histidinol-phosphatase (PHP family)